MTTTYYSRRGIPAAMILFGVSLMHALSCNGADTPSETPRESFWVTDGEPRTVHVSPSGKIVYVGGYFSAVGPPTGSFGVMDAATAEVIESMPIQRLYGGEIWSIVSDGAGGWFVGGESFAINDEPSTKRLVHILPDGTLDTSFPDVAGEVRALCLADATLYVGGRFEDVGTLKCANIAAINIKTAKVLPWAPWVTGGSQDLPDQAYVNAIDVANGRVYLGGWFSAVNGVERVGVAAVDTLAGATLDWDPDASDNTGVSALHVAGGKVYIGGSFTHVGGQPQGRLAAIDPDTGALVAWKPVLDQTVSAIASSNDTLYVGGRFTIVNGQTRSELASFDLSTGGLLPWNPSASGVEGTTPQVHSIAVASNAVYVGGHFTTIGGQQRLHLAAVDRITGQVLPWRADAAGPSSTYINSVAVHDGKVAAGGEFSLLGTKARRGIAAFDIATGALLPWSPEIPGGVLGILQVGCTVYVAGDFDFVNGVPQGSFAAIDARTGELIPEFAPFVAGRYGSRVAIKGSTLFIGGYFWSVNGFTRIHAAAIDATTGATLEDWDGGVGIPICGACHVEEISLSPDGRRVYFAGPFSTAGNGPDTQQWPLRAGVAAFDPETGELLNWAPAALPSNRPGRAVVDDGEHVWFGGQFRYFEPNPGEQYHRPHIAKLQRTNAVPTYWSTWVDGGGVPSEVQVIRRRENVVFFGGRFNTLQAGWSGGSSPAAPDWRYGLAAMRASTHLIYPWAPYMPGGATDIALSENSLFAVGGFSQVENRFRPGFAVFDFETRGIEDNLASVNIYGDCVLCAPDLDKNSNVNVFDLMMLLSSWGPCHANVNNCPADFTGDGVVDVLDLFLLLDDWGPC